MEITFVLPLALLPGVALLIVSSAARYGQIHDEVHRLLDHTDAADRSDLRRRARYFRNALVALYLCVACFALASLTGALLEAIGLPSRAAVVALTALGCLSLLYAAAQLIRETLLSLDIIEHHLLHNQTPRDNP